MKNNYRAVISGLGNIAWRFDQKAPSGLGPLSHTGAFIGCDKIILSGGYSPDKNDRIEFNKRFNVPTYNSLEDLLKSEKPHIVSICSPTRYHFTQTMLCIEYGIPMIWLEKPPTVSVSQIDLLIKELEKHRNKSKILVNYHRRYSPYYRQLKNICENNALGECRYIHINYSKGLELNGAHLLDILFYILGDDIEYTIEWVSTNGDYENPSFIIHIRDQMRATIIGQTLTYHCLDMALTFESGRISILHGGMTPIMEQKCEHEFYPGFFRLKQIDATPFDTVEFDQYMQAALYDLINSFERNQEPSSNLFTARNSQELIEIVKSYIEQKGQ